MTILNNGSNLLNNSLIRGAQNPVSNHAQPRKPSEFWLNVGVQAGSEFISLPVGLPLDDMKPAKANTNNAEWNQIAQAKNVLLEQIQQIAAQMEPGAEHELTLTVKLRRTAQNNEPASENNPLANAVLAALLGK